MCLAQIFVRRTKPYGRGVREMRHCTAAEAAEIARRADAKELAIVHMPPADAQNALTAAKEIFPAAFLPQEGETVEIPR